MTKELQHTHPWVNDNQVWTGWHSAEDNSHPHPIEGQIDYRYAESDEDKTTKPQEINNYKRM